MRSAELGSPPDGLAQGPHPVPGRHRRSIPGTPARVEPARRLGYGGEVRICSLVPGRDRDPVRARARATRSSASRTSATGRLRPPQRPKVTASLLQGGDLSSVEIDARCPQASADGKTLYAIDVDVWAEIEADIVVAQELCEVCAVSRKRGGRGRRGHEARRRRPRLLAVDPRGRLREHRDARLLARCGRCGG